MKHLLNNIEKRTPIIRARLAKSASGFVRVAKVSSPDRTALAEMIKRGEAEIFDSEIGRAYRLIVQPKPLLVGETNPFGPDPKFALYPHPPNCAGDRLCRKVMGLRRGQYLAAFDRVNLCSGKWRIREARSAAAEIMEPFGRLKGTAKMRPAIVLCGANVCNAFNLAFRPFEVRREPYLHIVDFDIYCSPTIVILPHPSGLCRLWKKEKRAFERAREALTAAGVLPVPEGLTELE